MGKLNIQNLINSSLFKYNFLFISGLLASFSLPPINLFPFIFFLSLPIFFLIKCRNWKEAFHIGFFSAFGWFTFSLYWLSNALIVSGGLGVLNTINAGGDVIAFASSDERLKDNIKPIENPLEVISQISGNTFDWNSEKQNIYNGKDYGVIAQEIQKVMPELVDTRDSGYLAVKYDKIVPLLIESIKELKKEIEELKSK